MLMNKIRLILTLFLSSLLIDGCSCDNQTQVVAEPTSTIPPIVTAADLEIYKFTDPDNGVQWYVYQNKVTGQGGMSARLNPDGTCYVDEGWKKE